MVRILEAALSLKEELEDVEGKTMVVFDNFKTLSVIKEAGSF